MLALPLLTPVARAQKAGASAAESEANLQEIVVTAQRREENVMTVPLSIQATTGEQLHDSGISDLTDLQFTTPGYLPTSGEGYTQIYVRGIGNNVFVGADPSVATFIDDVPRIYGSMNENLLDVERVEVLKGAQGGLYGRNATGGVVNIVTNQPNTDKFSGNAVLGYGELATFRAGAAVNVPVNDRVALELAAERDSHDPYVENFATANPYSAAMFPTGSFLGTPQQTASALNANIHPASGLNNQSFWATDDKLLVKLTDTLKITFAGDYSAKVDSNGTGNFDVNPDILQATLGYYYSLFGINAQLPPGLDKGAPGGKFTTAVGDPNTANTWDYGGSATVVWDAPGFDLTSITAYRGQSTGFIAGANAGTVPDVSFSVYNHKNFLYQELRAVSTNDGAFHWLGGATFLDNMFAGHTKSYFFGGIAPAGASAVTDTVHNWSVYAQGGYDFTPQLGLTVSGRYVHETNSALFTVPVLSGKDSSESKFLPSATLSYKVSDGNVYARYARGFKAGGVNPVAAPSFFPPGAKGSIFGPEQVDTFEVGYRQGLLDHRLQLTSSVFYNNYDGVQTLAHARPQFATTIIEAIINGGSARSWGAEATLDWRVCSPFTLGLNVGYLNAKYKTFSLKNDAVLGDFDLDGKTMLNSPTLQLSLTGNLDQPLTDQLRLVGNVVETHISDAIYQYSNIPGFLPDSVGPGYWLTNLRVGVRTRDDKYGVSVYANNLFNQAYYTYGNSAAFGNLYLWGNPRIVGGEISAKF